MNKLDFDNIKKSAIKRIENLNNFIWFNKVSSWNNFKDLKLCVGIAVSPFLLINYIYNKDKRKDLNFLTPHAWNINKKGEVIDITYGKEEADYLIYCEKIFMECFRFGN